MNRNIKTAQTTADGTSTLLSAQYGAHYHSLHGALTESQHIYIEAGLMASPKKTMAVLEVGFGTGLNAALTAQRATTESLSVTYHSLELHPLSANEYEMLNYDKQLPAEVATLWQLICNAEWGKDLRINEFFTIRKINADFTQWIPLCDYDIVYFDAFAPDDQPEMWSVEQFHKIYDAMSNSGILVTYSVKGVVKRTLAQVGFKLERLVGPPGKKHMLRALKEFSL